MTQKVSPFLEANYGWSLGESGWNLGMDQNLLTFSYLFDNNIDAVVSSLPAPLTGKSYYLTTDKRLYFVIEGVYYSTVVPMWFIVKIRSTGAWMQFDGSDLIAINNPTELRSALDGVVTTVNTKAPLVSPSFSGTPTAPTATSGTNNTQIASTAFTTSAISDAVATVNSSLSLKANLNSPTFTGTPIAPTRAATDNSAAIATTAFVNSVFGSLSRYETPEKYGYTTATNLTGRTAAVQAAFNAANTNQTMVLLSGTYQVSTVVLNSHTGYCIYGTGTIIGVDTAPHSAVLEIRNCTGLKSRSQIIVAGNGLSNYSAAIKVWGTGGVAPNLTTCSLHDLDFNVIGAPIGWQFGDLTAPDNLLSEIVIRGGYSYNTPVPLVVIGTQAFIEFSGYQLIAVGQGALASFQHSVVWTYGATVTITGCECQMPANTSGWCFVISPIASNNPGSFGNPYGNIYVNGAAVESAGLLLLAYNINSVASVTANTGGLRMSHSKGFHSFTGVSFQEIATSNFTGQLVVDHTNYFYAPTARTVATAQFAGNVEVRLSETAFNSNFRRGIYGIVGGVAKFEYQQIFRANTITAQVAAGNTTLVYTSVPADEANARFIGNYNSSTGVFTVPAGGLKSVQVVVHMTITNTSAGSALQVLVNGTPMGNTGANSSYANGTFNLGNLNATDTITVRFVNSAAAWTPSGSDTNNRFSISARC